MLGRGRQGWLRGALLTLLLAAALPVMAEPLVSIIIDDIGNGLGDGQRAVQLPGPVTCAFLPHTPYAAHLARLAHRNGKEVMLHLPMQAVSDRRLGPGGLTLDMGQARFLQTFWSDIASIPFVRGVNNHMGSLLTRHPGDMGWLMQAIRLHGGLYFVDSRTSRESVAQQVAEEQGVPTTHRDVFLDDVRTPAAIRRQFARLVAHAKIAGSAVAIGHPHPVTLATLTQLLPTLAQQGIRLVPVSELIAHTHNSRSRLWQASLSPSPRDARN